MNPLSIINATGAAKAAASRSALGLLAGLAFAALMGGTANAQTGTDGIMVLNNMTIPRGGVWLNSNAPSAGNIGGHLWQTDSVLGICRVDPLPGAVPPWHLTNCQGAAKSGGQAVVANPAINPATGQPFVAGLPAGAKFVFVPDAGSNQTNVVRYIYNPAGDGGLSSPLIMNAPNVAARGGGLNGGRPVAVALAPNGIDLYVTYIKSGDVMKISGATSTTSQTPTVTKIGSTSDGRGVRSMLMFGNDLYLAELGGFGLSKIADVAGVTRTPCAEVSPCTAVPIFPQVEFFPGGLTTDGTNIYFGVAPVNGTPGSVKQWNPATGALAIYSQNVPAYTSQFDGVTRTQYAGPLGLAFAPNGDLYVGDDPTYSLIAAVLPTLQGHVWRVPAAAVAPSVTSIAPTSGPTTGGTVVTITGTGFSTVPGATQVLFGLNPAANVTCASVSSCAALSPASLAGTVDVRVIVGGQTSAIAIAPASDQFTFVAPGPPPTGPFVNSIAPNTGATAGGTIVTISGGNLISTALPPTPTVVTFGGLPATSVTCANATTCTAVSPAGIGTVDVLVTVDAQTSAVGVGTKFTYAAPVATVFAWGITAPKGGMVWIPGNLGGHFWSSDHAQGFCRQDPVPGTTLHAINYAICDNGTIGSSGQAVYDTRVNPVFVNTTSGRTMPAGTHFIYVPDNAVKSTAVWRLTFDPTTETLLDVPEAMVPLADTRTLKPNGMVMGPDGNLYVSDLVEMNIRRLTNPNGDPRLQTIQIVAVTGDARGANGTMGVLGNKVYVSENRAAAWFDITACPTLAGPCATNPVPLPTGAFVAGVATDALHNLVYIADSPGGANATIWRHNPATGLTAVFLTGGQLPAAGTPNATVWCALTCTRPWDATLVPGGIAGFAFAFGIYNDPNNGDLYITGDATAGARSARGQAWVAKFVP